MTEVMRMLEVIGTIAFSVSGSLIACGAGLDIFGVVFVGCITAFGGGMIRDVIIGVTPPAIFQNYILFLVAVLSSIFVFIAAYMNKEKFRLFKSKIEIINNYFDAVGLAVFSVIGAEIGFSNCYNAVNILLIVICGMITGVGGGIIRDILIDTTPYVFKKYIYALASISGCLIYYLLKTSNNNEQFSSLISIFSVILIRIMATKYRWSLPSIFKC